MTNKKIILSLSGGESSGVLAYDLFTAGYDVVYLFANTGLENNETLDFVKAMEDNWGIQVVWLEAVVNPEYGKGITHRVTSYEKAFRVNQYKELNHPYHAFIRKHGIPNATYKQCSDRLKELVIEDYKKKNGLKGVKHALGMRLDEPNRVCPAVVRKILEKTDFNGCHLRGKLSKLNLQEAISKSNLSDHDIDKLSNYVKKIKKYNICYPMHDLFKKDKQDVKEFWASQTFGLKLEDHEGNCQTCWKKSAKKLHLLALEHPERFEPFAWFEKMYQHVKPNSNGNPRYFFRGHKSTDMILGEAKLMDAYMLRKLIGANPEQDAGCSESCEPYQF